MTDETQEALDTAQKLIDIAGQYSDEMTELVNDRAETASTNWLYTFGIPKTPAEVRQLIHIVYKGAIAALIHEGFTELTEKGTASEDELAKREESKTGQGNLFTRAGEVAETIQSIGQHL